MARPRGYVMTVESRAAVSAGRRRYLAMRDSSPVRCEECGRTCKGEFGLKTHQRMAHGGRGSGEGMDGVTDERWTEVRDALDRLTDALDLLTKTVTSELAELRKQLATSVEKPDGELTPCPACGREFKGEHGVKRHIGGATSCWTELARRRQAEEATNG